MNLYAQYKNKVASRYIPVDAEKLGMKLVESDYYLCSTKLDGFLVFLVFSNGVAKFFNKQGEELLLPQICNEAMTIKEDCLLVGELCCFKDGRSSNHREVSKAIAKPEKFDLRFAIFDIIEYNKKSIPTDPSEKFQLIKNLISGKNLIFPIEQTQLDSRADVITFFKQNDEAGEEGIIVKIPNGIIYKVKKNHHIDLVVIGYAESTGENEGSLRDLLLGTILDNGMFQIVAKIGSGFTEKERLEWLQLLANEIVSCDYTEVSGAKTAFNFVKPKYVVEISCLDIINEASEGSIKKACLQYDEKHGYKWSYNKATVSLISAQYIQHRKDKSAGFVDAGSSQLYAILEPLKENTIEEDLKVSEIKHREVYTKGTKAIRKFIGLKTNKESTNLYSPYVVLFVDFSVDRKTPMEQEIFLCQNEKEMLEKIDLLKAENIKKGWIKI